MPELEFNTSTLAASVVGAVSTSQLPTGTMPSGPVSFRKGDFIPLLWGGRDGCKRLGKTFLRSSGFLMPLTRQKGHRADLVRALFLEAAFLNSGLILRSGLTQGWEDRQDRERVLENLSPGRETCQEQASPFYRWEN